MGQNGFNLVQMVSKGVNIGQNGSKSDLLFGSYNKVE